MRRTLMVARASRNAIRAKRNAYVARMTEIEEYLGLLRAKCSVLEAEELEALDQIGTIRDAFDFHCLPSTNESSDDEFESDHPPSSDLFRLSSPRSGQHHGSSSSAATCSPS